MTLDQFRRTLTDPAPPQSLTAPLRALWFDGQGDWNQAHSVAQDVEDALARGYTPTCTARRETFRTRSTGTGVPASPSRPVPWTMSGRQS